eukprot:COSAG05_NODE_4477_length_1496_cov_3.491768_2_plen_309_part_00
MQDQGQPHVEPSVLPVVVPGIDSDRCPRCLLSALQFTDASNEDWACCGKSLPGGCVQEVGAARSSQSGGRLSCRQCSFDLCTSCFDRQVLLAAGGFGLNKDAGVPIHPERAKQFVLGANAIGAAINDGDCPASSVEWKWRRLQRLLVSTLPQPGDNEEAGNKFGCRQGSDQQKQSPQSRPRPVPTPPFRTDIRPPFSSSPRSPTGSSLAEHAFQRMIPAQQLHDVLHFCALRRIERSRAASTLSHWASAVHFEAAETAGEKDGAQALVRFKSDPPSPCKHQDFHLATRPNSVASFGGQSKQHGCTTRI